MSPCFISCRSFPYLGVLICHTSHCHQILTTMVCSISRLIRHIGHVAFNYPTIQPWGSLILCWFPKLGMPQISKTHVPFRGEHHGFGVHWVPSISSILGHTDTEVSKVIGLGLNHLVMALNATMWGPPVMERWFINPMNTIVIGTINHSYWSYKPT